MGTHTALGTSISALGSRIPFPYWEQQNLWIKGRSGLVMNDVINGNNAAILPSYLYKPTGDEYAYINDAGGVFDVNNADGYTMCGWARTEDAAKAGAQRLFGKYINGEPSGIFIIYIAQTTGYITAYSKTSAGTFTRAGAIDLSSAGFIFVIYEVDNLNSKIRLFVNNTQVGADLSFTGTFGNTTAPLAIGAINNGASYLIGKTSHSDSYVFNRILSAAEKTTLYNRGYVSGALAHWPCNSFNINDVSGNGYHMTGVNLTSAKIGYSASGSRHSLEKGYSLYVKAANPDIEVPFSDAGIALVSPTVPAGYSKLTDFAGSDEVHNIADSLIDFDPADATPAVLAVLDRSNVTYQNAASRAADDYDASNPYRYKARSVADPRILTAYFNEGYAGMPYQKITTELISGSYYPKTIEEVMLTKTDRTGADQLRLMKYCGTDVFAI